jgi:hypothetical protein
VIQVELRDTNLDKAKKEALDWFDAAGFSMKGICDIPVQFYINNEIAEKLRGKKDIVFSPLAEGCKKEEPPYVSEKPEGKVPNLIVLVHGCCTDEAGVSEWNKMGGEIAQKIKKKKDWEIVVWDWHIYTPPPLKGCILKDCADTAYKNAFDQGKKLANAINQYPIYKYIHLIGHSSGVNLIDVAAKELKLNYLKLQNEEDRPFIQLTFLDAYTPNPDEDKYAYGFLSGYPKHYTEHYVDRWTNTILPYTFNFDITGWTSDTIKEKELYGH